MEDPVIYASRYAIVKHDYEHNCNIMLPQLFTDRRNALLFIENNVEKFIQELEGIDKIPFVFTLGKDSEDELPMGRYLLRNPTNVDKITVCHKLVQKRKFMKTYYTTWGGWVPTLAHERPKTVEEVTCVRLFSLEVVEIPSSVCPVIRDIEPEGSITFDIMVPEKVYYDAKARMKIFAENLASLFSMAHLHSRFDSETETEKDNIVVEEAESLNLAKLRFEHQDEFTPCPMANQWEKTVDVEEPKKTKKTKKTKKQTKVMSST